MDIASEFIDLCLDNFCNGGHSSTKEQEHRYHDLKEKINENEKMVQTIKKNYENTQHKLHKECQATLYMEQISDHVWGNFDYDQIRLIDAVLRTIVKEATNKQIEELKN